MQQTTLNFIYFLSIIGAIVFAIFIGKLLWVLVKIILPQKNFIQRYGNDSWVVVTGGSDGIGLGFCQEFAALGFNICIIARNQDKIIKVLENIQRDSKLIKTSYVIADFSRSSQQAFFQQIFEKLQNNKVLQNISILVNNVGISNLGYLHEIPDKRLINEITVNCIPCALMSNHMIPHMLKRQNKSAIINVSSFAAQHPAPYVSNYSATKSFVNAFSQALSLQYSQHIDVLSYRPLFVQSNMSKQKASLTVATKNQAAKSAISSLGIDYQTGGYWMHRLISYVVNLLPVPLSRGMTESQSKKIMDRENKNKSHSF